MDNNTKLTEKRYLMPFVLITTLFFMWGFARAILDLLNKHFQNLLHISITQSSLIQVMTYLGYFLMAIPAGIFINRYGYRRGVVFGLLLFGFGALTFIPGQSFGFTAYLVALFIIGCGLTFLETAANPYVTELGPKETSSSRLNLSQSFNGLGSLAATFGMGLFLFNGSEEGGDVTVPYAIMGVVVLLIALLFSRAELPEIKHEEVESTNGENAVSEASSGNNFANLFKHKMFILGLLALLAYEVAEISINSYFINFVTGREWITSDRTASMVLTGALAFFMVGRFIGSAIMRIMRAERLLLICGIGCVVCMILVMLNLGTLSLIALVANYVFEAIMFPTIFALALQGLGNLTKTASSLLMMTPVGGCAFLLVGLIADNDHAFRPFFLPLLCYLLVAVFALKILKKKF